MHGEYNLFLIQQRAELIIQSPMKIEIKKEIGWLIFMLIPFLVLLVVHFVIPLSYIMQTLPLLQDNYNAQQILLRHHNIRSTTQTNSRIVNRKLTKYYESFNNFKKLIDQNSSNYQQTNLTNAKLNNAFLFSQKVLNNTLGYQYKQQVSMWFATNITAFDGLTPLQQQIYLMYANIEPFLRAQLIPLQTKSLSSIDTYIQMSNESMFFQFPSKYEVELSTLADDGISSYYEPTIDNYYKFNLSISSFLQMTTNETIQLRLCTLLKNNIWGIYGISCLNMNMNLLGMEMINAMSLFFSKFSTSSYCLVLPVFIGSTVNYLTIYQFGQNVTSINTTNYLQNTFTLTSNNKIQIFRSGYSTYIFSPISLEDESQHQNIMLYFLTTNQYLTTTISSSSQFNSSLNLYLALVITFIVISFIASFCVLKQLMNGLDDELIELQNRCNFIFDGDINIEIPNYAKTKDIKDVYDKVRIINKIHRYSTSQYFTGHHVSKILKYTEAMQFFTNLNYDIGYILQNLGESYLLMEQYEKSIQCLRQSLKIILAKIQDQYGTIDHIMKKKKERRVSMNYKEMQLVLIRRSFGLVQSIYILINNWSKYHFQSYNAAEDKKIKQAYMRDVMDYIMVLKKAFYPEYAFYAESVVIHLFETTLYKDKGNVEAARQCLNKSFKISDIYIDNYPEVTKKLKQKGSKYKFFHLKNRLTSISRMHPEAVKAFKTFVKATVVAAEAKKPHFNDYQAVNLLFESIKFNLVRDRLMMGAIFTIKGILSYHKCDMIKFQTTQLYRQVIPFKGYQDQQTKGPRMLNQGTLTMDRQFVYLVDCWKNTGITQDSSQYFQERSITLFDKLAKPKDRISIIKFNTLHNIKIQCSLTLKQSKEQMLKKQILDSFSERGGVKLLYNELFEAYEKAIHRIKKLRNQKVILIFFKKIADYSEHLLYIRKKQRSRSRHYMNSFSEERQSLHEIQSKHEQFNKFGEWMVELIVESSASNCKICLFINQDDKPEQFIKYFGLEDINKRLWRQFDGINKRNNLIYILSPSHKSDIDRILMSKVHENPDNHIFIL